MKNYLTIGSGLLLAICMFMPFLTIFGITQTGMAMEGVAYFYIVCGIIIAIVGFVGKRWLNILSLLLGLMVAFMALKYQGDAKAFNSAIGIGLWLMLASGVLAVIGSIMGMVRRKKNV